MSAKYSVSDLKKEIRAIGNNKPIEIFYIYEGGFYFNDYQLDIVLSYRLGKDRFETAEEHAKEIFEEMSEHN